MSEIINNIHEIIKMEVQKQLKDVDTSKADLHKYKTIATYKGNSYLDVEEEQILKLHAIEGKNYNEISTVIGLTEANIKQKANNIKNKLGANNMPQATYLYFFYKYQND